MIDYDGVIGVQVTPDNYDELNKEIQNFFEKYFEGYREKITMQKIIERDNRKCRLIKNKEIELTRINIRKENKKHDEFRRKS